MSLVDGPESFLWCTLGVEFLVCRICIYPTSQDNAKMFLLNSFTRPSFWYHILHFTEASLSGFLLLAVKMNSNLPLAIKNDFGMTILSVTFLPRDSHSDVVNFCGLNVASPKLRLKFSCCYNNIKGQDWLEAVRSGGLHFLWMDQDLARPTDLGREGFSAGKLIITGVQLLLKSFHVSAL